MSCLYVVCDEDGSFFAIVGLPESYAACVECWQIRANTRGSSPLT